MGIEQIKQHIKSKEEGKTFFFVGQNMLRSRVLEMAEFPFLVVVGGGGLGMEAKGQINRAHDVQSVAAGRGRKYGKHPSLGQNAGTFI